MPDVPETVTNPEHRRRLSAIQRRLEQGLPGVDPHRRLVSRPVNYRVVSGHTLEITYRDVTSIDEAEVLGVKRVIGETCYCSVSPQTAETLTVKFVVPLEAATRG